MADRGDIELGVSLNAKDITKATSQLQAEIAKIFANNAGKPLDSTFKSLQAQMARTSNTAMKLSNSITELRAKQIDNEKQSEIIGERVNEYLKKEQQYLKEKAALQDKVNRSAGNPNDNEKYKAQLEAVEDRLKTYSIMIQESNKELDNLAVAHDKDAEKLDNYNIKLSETNNQMTTLLTKYDELGQKQLPKSEEETQNPFLNFLNENKMANLANLISGSEGSFSVLKATGEGVKLAFMGIGTALKNLIPLLGKAAVSAGKFALNLAKIAGRTVLNGVKKLASGIRSLFSHMTRKSDGSIKSMSRLALSIVGIQGAFGALRKAANAYLQDNEELGRRLQGIWTSLGYFIGPAIEYIINLVARLFGAINSLVRALTGVDMVAKASAAALKKEGEAAAKAGRQMAAFDEMNTLSDNSGGSSSGPTFDFPEVDIGNLDDLGTTIAEKINEVIKGIDWDKIQSTIKTAIRNVVLQINKFIAGLDWKALGNTLAQGINTLIGIGTELRNVNLAGLAYNLAHGLNEAVKNIDWKQLGSNLGAHIRGILDGLTIFISEFDWVTFGNNIKDFLIAIDWPALFKAVGRAVGAAVKYIFSPITDYFASFIEQAKEEYPDNMFGLAGNIVDGLLLGLWNAMKNIGVWIWENMVSPFIEGFKELFGINSPSTVMEELGGYIVDGLKNGVSGVWDAIKQFFEELPGNIQAFFQNLPQWFSAKFQNIREAIGEKWENIKQEAADTWQAIKDVFSPVTTWFSNKFGTAWAKVKEIFADEDGQFTFESISEGIKNVFKDIVNNLITGLNRVIAIPFNKINSILNYIKSIEVLGISPFYNLWRWNPVYVPQIPYLAQGAVIPPNKEFMAILGDQKQGTNIEAPLDTIKQALREVQDENQVQPTPVYFNVDGKTFAKAMIKWEKKLEFNFNG